MRLIWRKIDRLFHGHINIGPITIYGRNAMHFATNVRTPWGWFCFRPTIRCFGQWWPWYVYLSTDGTPCKPNMRWGFGPGMYAG
jgi:hypothetical protein